MSSRRKPKSNEERLEAIESRMITIKEEIALKQKELDDLSKEKADLEVKIMQSQMMPIFDQMKKTGMSASDLIELMKGASQKNSETEIKEEAADEVAKEDDHDDPSNDQPQRTAIRGSLDDILG